MTESEIYNQRMKNYLRQVELNIEDAQLAIAHSNNVIKVLEQKVKCDEEYLLLSLKELDRAKEVLRKFNENNGSTER